VEDRHDEGFLRIPYDIGGEPDVGLELSRRLKASHASEIPVIGLSGYDPTDESETHLDAYLDKPPSLGQLLKLLRAIEETPPHDKTRANPSA
jgi:CheY-like chemotaxis protein